LVPKPGASDHIVIPGRNAFLLHSLLKSKMPPEALGVCLRRL
jgi:hypothetical protein